MGRHCIGKRAMTAAERQRRKRKKDAATRKLAVRQALKAKRRSKIDEKYIPAPNGLKLV